MYDQPLYAKIKAACGEFSDVDVIKKPCSTLLEEMNDKVGEFDVYNIYDTCGQDRGGNRDKAKAGLKFLEIEETMASDTITIPAKHANTLAAKRHPQLESKLGGALNDYPCGGESTASEWLAQPDVVKALHVKADGGGMTYQKGPMEISGDLRPLYAKLIPKYRMLIYSGDTDGCVPCVHSQRLRDCSSNVRLSFTVMCSFTVRQQLFIHSHSTVTSGRR